MKILLGKTEKSYYWTWLDGPDEMEPNTEQVYELVPVGELVGGGRLRTGRRAIR